MNRQAIYNQIRKALLAQGEKSLPESGSTCKYRLDQTAQCKIKCAIGHVIPDEMYDPYMDSMGMDVRGLLGRFPEIAKHLGVENDEDIFFLRELQGIHDDVPVEEWAGRLDDFADRYEMKP